MDDLIDQTATALSSAGDDPVDRFIAVVVAHVRYHCDRPEESFIGNSELRSLSPEALERIVAKRDRQQAMFDETLIEGIRAGFLHAERPKEAARAIVTMCTAVATWYHRDGPLSADEIVRIYRDLALRTAGYYDHSLPD
jgi:AcrR family transcriptional regulator